MLKRTDYQVIPTKRVDNLEIITTERIEEPTNICCYSCFIFSNWLYKKSATPKTPKNMNLIPNENIFDEEMPLTSSKPKKILTYEMETEPKNFWCFFCFHFSKIFQPQNANVQIEHEMTIENPKQQELIPIIKIEEPTTTERVREEISMMNLDIAEENLLCTEYSQTPLSPSSLSSPFDDKFSSYNNSPRSEEDHPDIIDFLNRRR